MEKTVAFFTLGCRVNQYETAAMEEIFRNNDYNIVSFDESADIYVVNTCAVTAESERKCRQILRRAKKQNPNSLVVAVGCMVQASKEDVLRMAEVDVAVGVSRKQDILNAITDKMNTSFYIEDMSKVMNYHEMSVSDFSERDRAFVKIQDGCDRFCSYCIIPYLRGRVRSRNPQDILSEIHCLSEKGFQEVVLTGIHVASFGMKTDYSLAKLIRDVSKIPGISRIRLSSIDPNAFTDELLETYRNTEKLCPQFHISLQSGSTSVLKRMNRRYTADEYEDVVNKLREIRPLTSITTDIITGFPGETEEEFRETLSFVERIRFSGIHVFPYSERQGTVAAQMPNQVPKHIRAERAKILIGKAAEFKANYARQFIGTTQSVLFEHKQDAPSGYTPHYIRVVTPSVSDPSSLSGKIADVEIINLEGEILYGRIK